MKYGEYIAFSYTPSEQELKEAVKSMKDRALQFLLDKGALQIIVKRNTDPDMWPTDSIAASVAWKLDTSQLINQIGGNSND